MKKYGKIISYDGDFGIIMTKDGQVEFASEDLLTPIKINDYVVFRQEKRDNLFLARFISAIETIDML
jgi:hypothetical protein